MITSKKKKLQRKYVLVFSRYTEFYRIIPKIRKALLRGLIITVYYKNYKGEINEVELILRDSIILDSIDLLSSTIRKSIKASHNREFPNIKYKARFYKLAIPENAYKI